MLQRRSRRVLIHRALHFCFGQERAKCARHMGENIETQTQCALLDAIDFPEALGKATCAAKVMMGFISVATCVFLIGNTDAPRTLPFYL